MMGRDLGSQGTIVPRDIWAPQGPHSRRSIKRFWKGRHWWIKTLPGRPLSTPGLRMNRDTSEIQTKPSLIIQNNPPSKKLEKVPFLPKVSLGLQVAEGPGSRQGFLRSSPEAPRSVFVRSPGILGSSRLRCSPHTLEEDRRSSE